MSSKWEGKACFLPKFLIKDAHILFDSTPKVPESRRAITPWLVCLCLCLFILVSKSSVRKCDVGHTQIHYSPWLFLEILQCYPSTFCRPKWMNVLKLNHSIYPTSYLTSTITHGRKITRIKVRISIELRIIFEIFGPNSSLFVLNNLLAYSQC